MVFAKNSKAAERLSKQIVDGEMTKQYLTAVLNCPKEKKVRLSTISKERAYKYGLRCDRRRPQR